MTACAARSAALPTTGFDTCNVKATTAPTTTATTAFAGGSSAGHGGTGGLRLVLPAGEAPKNPPDSKKNCGPGWARAKPWNPQPHRPTHPQAHLLVKPTKGGDGGVAPRPTAPGGGHQHALDNRRTVLTGAAEKDCVPTADPFDRAHNMRDGAGRLLSGAVEAGPQCYKPRQGTRPRLYHASQLVAREYERKVTYDRDGRPAGHADVLVRGISVDSAADSLFEAQERLAGIPGLGPAEGGVSVHERSRARLVSARGYTTARAIMSPDATR